LARQAYSPPTRASPEFVNARSPHTNDVLLELSVPTSGSKIKVIEQTGNMYVRDFGNCGVPCFNLGNDSSSESSSSGHLLAGDSVRLCIESLASRLVGGCRVVRESTS
jgi:hypothetical protein